MAKQNNSPIDAAQYSIHILNEYHLDPLFQATQRMFQDSDLLTQLAINKQNCIHAQGWVFEQLEVMKFNQNATEQFRYDIFAATTDGMRQPHAAADILIKNTSGEILREAQLKSCDSPTSSAFALANEKYQGMQRIAPSEQTEKIDQLYQQRIDSGTLKAPDYQDAQKNLEEGVTHDGVSSGGTTRQEAIDASNPEYAEQLANDFKREALFTECHQAGLQAGLMGAAIGGGITVISEGIKVFQGKNDAEFSQILLNITTNTVTAGTTSYVTAFAARGVAHVAEQNMASASANALIKGNGHIALATSAVRASKSIYRYMTDDDMTTEELMSDINHIALTGAGAFYYGALGQVLIPIPVVGAMIGSTVGYFIGNLIHQSGLIALGESNNVKVARERRERIEQLCLHAIPQMRAARLEMERVLHENTIARREFINNAFNDVELSLLASDADQYIAALNSINGVFGKDIGFNNLNEFNELMEDSEFAFVL